MTDLTTRPSASRISRYGLLIAVLGAVAQLVLSVYYLSMGHAPRPHDLPVGVVASAQQQQQVAARLEKDGQFSVDSYDSQAELTEAIRSRKAYGGVVVAADGPTLYVAGAASPAVANLLRGLFAEAVPARAQAVTDVVPLPKDDPAGSSLGFLIQAVCLGGSIASLALGRLGRLTRRSVRRGLGHAALLVVYALGSAAVVLLAMRLIGVGDGADQGALFWGFALVSLAITASTAGFVALFGPAGALVGALYFTLGLVISGSSIAPEMLPTAGRVVGQALPPGAGATVLRDALYFPDANASGAFVVLGLFAGVGLAVVLVTNALANHANWSSRIRLPRLSRDR